MKLPEALMIITLATLSAFLFSIGLPVVGAIFLVLAVLARLV